MKQVAKVPSAAQEIAIRKYADQYGNLGPTLQLASNVNDGDPATCNFLMPLFGDPWWQVDLGKRATVSSVSLLSNDAKYINPFDVTIGDDGNDGGINNPICISNGTVTVTVITNIKFPAPMQGRYVAIHRTRSLSLCELEVYGYF
eukprot:Seg735.1 transcript_id=Seg735.1/GoldUCD/mRNA.D3Y31 product=Fucolectin-4 protein_id=Seg735.1/GoldUCD/D3Y31